MTRSILQLTLIVLIFSTSAKAQSSTTKDTIYYLFDIEKVPLNDRMFNVDTMIDYVQYSINCRCSKSNTHPVFVSKRQIGETLTLKSLNNKKLITLASLINLTKLYSSEEFNKKYETYFIEPFSKFYQKRKVKLAPEDNEPSNDVHIDSIPGGKKP
jgi:hypothetical protein